MSKTDTKMQRAIDLLESQPDYSRESILRVCKRVPCSERWVYEARDRLLLREERTSKNIQLLKEITSDLNWMSSIIAKSGLHKSFTSIEREKWDDIAQRLEVIKDIIIELKKDKSLK